MYDTRAIVYVNLCAYVCTYYTYTGLFGLDISDKY